MYCNLCIKEVNCLEYVINFYKFNKDNLILKMLDLIGNL